MHGHKCELLCSWTREDGPFQVVLQGFAVEQIPHQTLLIDSLAWARAEMSLQWGPAADDGCQAPHVPYGLSQSLQTHSIEREFCLS
jgi:hypothetical protein